MDEIHPAIRWLTLKWPAWLKALATLGTIGGAIGTVLGIIGACEKSVNAHDEGVRDKVLAEHERVQRDQKIDDTLKYHGQEIWTIGKKQDVMDGKLDEIAKDVKR